jgi:DUF1680 family protein
MTSYLSLFQKTGSPEFGDLAERIFYNAAQGSRHPEKNVIAYLKTDNSYIMDGTKNGDSTQQNKQTRYKYSPVHQDVAVCCIPNAGKIAPSFVSSMWMKDSSGLVASLLGPNEIHTSINGSAVSIVEETGYPFENMVVFKIEMEKPLDFSLRIRKPGWVKKFSVDCDYREEGSFIVIESKWKTANTVIVKFEPEPAVHHDINGESYFSLGALVYAAPFESIEKPTRKFPLPGFSDYSYYPARKNGYSFIPGTSDVLNVILKKKGFSYPLLETILLNTNSQKQEKVTLVPIGKTILRQVTFR